MIQPLPTASASPARQIPRHRKKSADLRRAMRMWGFYRFRLISQVFAIFADFPCELYVLRFPYPSRLNETSNIRFLQSREETPNMSREQLAIKLPAPAIKAAYKIIGIGEVLWDIL